MSCANRNIAEMLCCRNCRSWLKKCCIVVTSVVSDVCLVAPRSTRARGRSVRRRAGGFLRVPACARRGERCEPSWGSLHAISRREEVKWTDSGFTHECTHGRPLRTGPAWPADERHAKPVAIPSPVLAAGPIRMRSRASHRYFRVWFALGARASVAATPPVFLRSVFWEHRRPDFVARHLTHDQRPRVNNDKEAKSAHDLVLGDDDKASSIMAPSCDHLEKRVHGFRAACGARKGSGPHDAAPRLALIPGVGYYQCRYQARVWRAPSHRPQRDYK